MSTVKYKLIDNEGYGFAESYEPTSKKELLDCLNGMRRDEGARQFTSLKQACDIMNLSCQKIT
jgi:hypothetical protein